MSATAILIGWQRLDNLPKITAYLTTKPWIEEIIVWNNGHGVLPALPAKARIVVPQANLRDFSKYQACTAAATAFCFYQDDDFDTSKYIDNLWDAAMAHPQTITSATDTFTWSTNEFWSVFDDKLGLHAQFSWIGCGAMFPRALAMRHLKIMHEFFTPAEQGIADVAFAWATNQVPVQQLQVQTVSLNSARHSVAYSSQISNVEFHDMRVKTLKALPRIVAKFPLPWTGRKAPSSLCYFVAAGNHIALCASWRPYPTHSVPFNINSTSDLNKRTRMHLYRTETKAHRAHPFLDALDGNSATWWQSVAVPVGGVWGISAPMPHTLRIVGNGPDVGWHVMVDGGAPVTSAKLWDTAWDVQHNVTFTWAGAAPTNIKINAVKQTTYRS